MSQRPRKLIFVTTDLRTGGAENMLAQLVTAKPRLADAIIVVSLLPPNAYCDRLHAAGIRTVEFNFATAWGALSGLVRLARLIAVERPDIVQGWMYHGDLAALLALAMSGRRRRTALIWSIRCSALELTRYGLVLRLVIKSCALLSGRPDVVIANSAAGMTSHLALGYHPRRCEIIANGIDTDTFAPDPAARLATRGQLRLSEDCIVVAHVARVDPMKDHETFLGAMAELPELRALMIGAGTEYLPDSPNIRRLGLRNDVGALLAAADIVVSSSAFGEGFSNAIAEGMACGLPAVATEVGDACDIVGNIGVLVPPRNPQALAAAMRSLAAEPAAARAVRAARSRERIAKRFSLDRAVARFAALYGGILAGTVSARPSSATAPTR